MQDKQRVSIRQLICPLYLLYFLIFSFLISFTKNLSIVEAKSPIIPVGSLRVVESHPELERQSRAGNGGKTSDLSSAFDFQITDCLIALMVTHLTTSEGDVDLCEQVRVPPQYLDELQIFNILSFISGIQQCQFQTSS